MSYNNLEQHGKSRKTFLLFAAFVAVLAVIGLAYVLIFKINSPNTISEQTTNNTTAGTQTSSESEEISKAESSSAQNNVSKPVISVSYERPSMIQVAASVPVEANVPGYTIDSDLGNVYNHEKIAYWDDTMKQQLAQDGFLITSGGGSEIFSVYEGNRYDNTANFITVDSIMHIYHLYFSYLLRQTEQNHLTDNLNQLSSAMLSASKNQYDTVTGTVWEDAALTNYIFFAVGYKLLEPSYELPSEVAAIANQELSLIEAAQGITTSPLLQDMEDYSQYIPRGYYESSEDLKQYFKAMMWYGRRNFTQSNDTHNRSALLMTLALHDDGCEDWEAIYSVTSFFAGASDDSGFYEYMPVLQAAYGDDVTLDDLVSNVSAYDTCKTLLAQLDPPKINSVPVYASDSDEEKAAKIIGFRFMGQRFSIDEAIFQKLTFSNTQENEAGEYRMLPDALDLPAVLGSERALEILEAQGDTKYANYTGNLDTLRTYIQESDEKTWYNSLYSNWLYTLTPLTESKSDGYPMFMQSDRWDTKNLITFLGSYSELKHDTVLYSKQMIAEMGGGDMPELDDRGYVEPEVLVYARLVNLVNCTKAGLEQYGYLQPTMKEDLELLSVIAQNLQTISEKELRNELPTEDEFEFIRTYGGQLEHFWQEVYREESENGYPTTQEFPGAVICDVATNPNGSCLEVGTGAFQTIYVVAPVDGTLKLCVGGIYSFYQFEQPISNRLTDTEWRLMLGLYYDFENPDFNQRQDVPLPAWESELVHEW